MQTTVIREKLHPYIDSSDEKLLKLMLALAKEYNDEDNFDYEFTSDEIKTLDQRREDRLSGKSKIHTREEAKNIITGKRELFSF